jgi:hypothetical protein
MATVCLLQFYNRVATVYDACSKCVASALRRALGPEPARIFLMRNGDIVSATPGLNVSEAYVYNPATHQIRSVIPDDVRRRPVPFVALSVTNQGVTTDLSEWVGEVRSAPLPFPITAAHLVDLYCLAFSTYIPSDATIQYTTNTGEEGTATRSRS